MKRLMCIYGTVARGHSAFQKLVRITFVLCDAFYLCIMYTQIYLKRHFSQKFSYFSLENRFKENTPPHAYIEWTKTKMKGKQLIYLSTYSGCNVCFVFIASQAKSHWWIMAKIEFQHEFGLGYLLRFSKCASEIFA